MRYTTESLRTFAELTGRDAEFWENTFANLDDEYGLVSYGDIDYPFIIDKMGEPIKLGYTTKRDEYKTKVPNKKGAPHYLLYRGDISLLNKDNFKRNVAVIGLLNPTTDIAEREKVLVEEIVKKGGNIVSGLALGCDSIAHRVCLENKGKTIAVLPSRLDNILPRGNIDLANEIVAKGGLLVTEYYNEPVEKFESSARYIERDRLQAYFSNSIVLIASYRHPGEHTKQYPKYGIKRDSGSRYAMKTAGDIGRNRYVLFSASTDANNEMFDLNKDLLVDKKNPAKSLNSSSIDKMINCELSSKIQGEFQF